MHESTKLFVVFPGGELRLVYLFFSLPADYRCFGSLCFRIFQLFDFHGHILGACKLQAFLLPAVSQYLIKRVNNRSRLINAISRLHPPAYQSNSEADCKPFAMHYVVQRCQLHSK